MRSISRWHPFRYCLYILIDFPFFFQVPIALPIIVLAFSIGLVLTPIMIDPRREYIYALCILFAGMIFYFPFIHWKLRIKYIRE